jgi:hypothetical protein
MAKRKTKYLTKELQRGEVVLGHAVFSADGDWWVCYHGWKGGPELSRVKLKPVEQNDDIRKAFMLMNSMILSSVVKREQRKMKPPRSEAGGRRHA